MPPTVTEVPVAIVGAGPAGLMLSHLLARRGVASTAIDIRPRQLIEDTQRAGILEPGSVRLLEGEGVSDRFRRDGDQHHGVDLRFDGESHRIDFQRLVGESVWLYPQTDVFIDLADARRRDGGDVRFGVRDVQVGEVTGDRPWVRFTDDTGEPHELRAKVVIGADGSRSSCRLLVPESRRRQYFKQYPFAWFGVMVEAPQSAPELIYASSARGFALISQRTETLQRWYFQCRPDTDVEAWSEDRILSEFQARVSGKDGFQLTTGPVLEKSLLQFRSFVQEPMRHGRLVLVGDAAHTVPPTGAKGLNLALSDVRLLAPILARALESGDFDVLERYQPQALRRVWRGQSFSYWMTQMLHSPPGDEPFDLGRQFGELSHVVGTDQGRSYLAEGYTGWPHDPDGDLGAGG